MMALAVGLAAPSAVAQGGAAAAEVLFQQGRDLLSEGKLEQACPKLAESQRLDPATGTLLALAMCHEAQGKLASAWAAFTSVASLSYNEGRVDREQVARQRVAALQPRLSTLEISVPQEVMALSGVELRRNGLLLGTNVWNLAVPVDGAEYEVTVTAPGMQPWTGRATVKNEGDVVVLKVPALQDAIGDPSTGAAPRTTLGATARPASAQQPGASTAVALTNPAAVDGSATGDRGPNAGDDGWTPLQWAGVSTAGAGVVALGVGGYFMARALGKNADSEKDCVGNLCGDQGDADRHAAQDDGNTATVFAIVGGVLSLGGAAMFFLVDTTSGGADATTRASVPRGLQLGVSAGPGNGGLQVRGQF